MDPVSLYIGLHSVINGNWVTIFIFIEKSLGLGLRYISLRHTHNVQMANRWYRPKHQPPKEATIFFGIGGSWISESTSAIFLWFPLFDDQKFYDLPSGATMLKKHVVVWMQEGRKWHFGGNWVFLQILKVQVKRHILSHSAGLNSKSLHFYGRNKISKNNDIQRKSEHEIAFPAECTYDLIAFTRRCNTLNARSAENFHFWGYFIEQNFH